MRRPIFLAANTAACVALVVLSAASGSAWSEDNIAAPSDWLTRDTLTGDWGGGRTWLQDRGIILEPRLSQFYQGLSAGDGDDSHDYGGKADLRMAADLARLGAWDGLSMVVHAEYNFGTSANGRGGVMIPVNTALYTPGMDGGDAFDISSFYFIQAVGNGASVAFGKINMIDLVAGKPFMGGAGIDSFWNHTFTATPTGTVPPYLLGVLASVPTDAATYRLWVYDLHSYTNRSVFDDPFAGGVSIRGQVDFNVTIGGRRGHQGFSAFYSSQGGTDLETLGDTIIPSPTPGTPGIKESRYYLAYSFDHYLREVPGSPGAGFGVFGQIALSDGNPNGLHWSMFLGVGGAGLFAGRSKDRWGAGYFYDGFSQSLKDSLADIQTIRDEAGLEVFYDFVLTPWCHMGADLQVIRPGLGESTAVIPGLRAVVRL
jgi:porin